jgi:GT2 family glycosyltransferase
MQLRVAFTEGACGAVAFAWTDEWWRGGAEVDDWAFGLVDRDRRPKPALDAVESVFAEVPFPQASRRRWPRVSVVVCAYNASDTIDECLASLGRLTYPDYEVIVVNDGSKDATGEIARRHPHARVIDTLNNGLSTARNVGLSAATGEIVAYTDADVRVDPDWLTFLVQPFLTSDVMGAGGPNVVPDDDPWVAQCVARAPGGPTHVLIDDRVAEHVPGCNMAFRREALLAIGGFNPIYLRAGDDVDVCWRLQARGWTLGFAPTALVWHRHRASIRAYWRQQVGYGEGEVWLAPHHPDKFEGSHIRWRGHIYSSLPFLRRLSRTRVNAGVWGTADFPSVYRTDAFPFAFMPHSVAWQGTCLFLILAGLAGLVALPAAVSGGLAAAGLLGFLVTGYQCVRYALASDIRTLPPVPGWSLGRSRFVYRATIALLHFLQPFARIRGRIRGRLSAPEAEIRSSASDESPSTWQEVRYTLAHSLAHRELQFWAETWTGSDSLLTRLADALRATRLTRVLEIDDGWEASRDISVALGRWGWVDLRLLREEHGDGKGLVRVARGIRVTAALVLLMVAGVVVLAIASRSPVARWPLGYLGAAALLASGWAVSRAALTITAIDRIVARSLIRAGLTPCGPHTEGLAATLGGSHVTVGRFVMAPGQPGQDSKRA